MNILITNDDGVGARGIKTLAEKMLEKHNVIVVAPREQKSASSHSISINIPIKIREEKIEGLDCKAYSIVGTPADCTQAGISLLAKDIDLVISGINRGFNSGIDILYSGTVSAAIEGAIYDVPSIAISMDVDWNRDDEDYSKAANWVSKVVNLAEKKYLKKNVVLNVNVPNINEEGRIIYDNIRKFIRYLLSCNLGEVLTMFLATLFYLPNPLSPIQILLVNLATDGLPAIALGVDPADSDIMRQTPRAKNESIFARGLVEKIVVRGSLIGICTLLSFMIGRYYGMNLETCRTLALCTLVMSQLIHVFECRSERHSIFEIKLFTNPYLVGAVLISIIMITSVLYIPFFRGIFHTVALSFSQWLIVMFFSGIIALINSVYLLIKSK